MLFSNTLKATAAASLVLACASVNAQSSWKSSQDLGLYVNPTKGISSNVTIGASPTSSLSKTRLTVKSEEGQGGLRIFNSAGDTKLWLNEKGGLSVGTSSSATTNGLLVSGQTRLRANLIVDNGADIKGGMKLDGGADIKGGMNVTGTAQFNTLNVTGLCNLRDICNFNILQGDEFQSQYIDGSELTAWRQIVLMGDYKDHTPMTRLQFDIFSNEARILAVNNYRDRDFNMTIYAHRINLHNNVSIGSFASTYTPTEKLEVAGNAKIHGNLSCKGQIEVAELKANDIQMDMHNAADYVFDENYNLKSLSEVENYVNEHKHLPGMPSAAEMEENGISVSKLSNLLLEKVEELTLHMIKMESHMNELEMENAALKAKVELLSK